MLMRARSWRLPFPVVCASRSSGRRRVESAKTSLFQGPQHTPALISTLVERRQLFGQNVHCHSSHDTTNRAPVYSAISQRLAATAPEQETTPDLSPWMSRDLLMRERATIFEFKVNGVSFHNRQQLLRRLEPKHAIMMVPEPENKHDPFAITVKTTEGQMLGFVPKEINRYPEFKGGVHFGHVASTGTVESEPEMKGFRVGFHPQLLPLHVIAAPQKLNLIIQSLQGLTCDTGYQDLSKAVLQEAGKRCQISGALCEELAVVPEWFEDTKQHKFVLLKLVCVSPQLKAAKDSLLEGEPTELELWTFQVMNGWVTSEMQGYLRYLRALQKQREGEDWSVDVSLIERGQREE